MNSIIPRKKEIAALALVILALIGWLLFSKTQPATVAPVEKVSQNSAVTTALAQASPRAVAVIESNFNHVTAAASPASTAAPAPAGTATAPEFTAIPAEIVLENVRTAIHNYGSRFGGNPVGTNPEIVRALAGENPKQVNFINPEAGLRVNDQGEMIDAWGTPFFFHQISGTEMEIRSAGPDKKMWTADDLVTR